MSANPEALIIPWTGDDFIDGLMKELEEKHSNRPHAHRPIQHIYEQALQYFLENGVDEHIAMGAAQAVAKNRRASLDKGCIKAAIEVMTE